MAFALASAACNGGGGGGGGGGGRGGGGSPTVSSSVSTPTITTPSSSHYYSNVDNLTISGTCTTGFTVTLSGAEDQTTTCAAGNYSFTVNRTSDGTYSFNVRQTSLGGVVSSAATAVWWRDTGVPSAPTITSPNSSGSLTGTGTSIDLGGACENGATVTLAGSDSGTVTCDSNAYSFNLIRAVGNYSYTVKQTDRAGNQSGTTSFTWNVVTAPATPTRTDPSADAVYSNGDNLTFSGSCTSGLTVTLSGSDSQTTTCASSAYSFTINKTSDATYSFSVKQTNLGVDSASVSATWIRDTGVPSAPTITSPNSTGSLSGTSSNTTIGGACETNATVTLTLSGGGSTTMTCSSSAYSFSVSQTTPATYNYTVKQTDRAGNVSGTTAFAWTVVGPMTISGVLPNTGGVAGGTLITISGSNFQAGATVSMGSGYSGAPQLSCANVAVNSSSEIQCETPSNIAQAVNVSVTSGGETATSNGAFTYTGTATLTILKARVFGQFCTGCHSGGAPPSNFDATINSHIISRVSAGNAAGSLIYQRIDSGSMPQNGPDLSSRPEKTAIADWINAGALEN